MLKQTLFFTQPCKLSLRLKQIVIERHDLEMPITRPIEDVSVIVLENQQISISIPLLNALSDANVVVVICNERCMPNSMIMPLEANNTQHEGFLLQQEASLPTKKKMWQEIITQKIKNQALFLTSNGEDDTLLRPLYENVKSGDSDNREGTAARIYWSKYLPQFTRDRYGFPPNHLLNYGYTILRAATARAIMGTGLHPAFGLFHKNRYNAFPLADDLMEPYRPFVDAIAYDLYNDHPTDELTMDDKKALINVLYSDVIINGQKHPLQVALSLTTASMLKVLKGTSKKLALPTFVR